MDPNSDHSESPEPAEVSAMVMMTMIMVAVVVVQQHPQWPGRAVQHEQKLPEVGGLEMDTVSSVVFVIEMEIMWILPLNKKGHSSNNLSPLEELASC
jgi:hypothetical protein